MCLYYDEQLIFNNLPYFLNFRVDFMWAFCYAESYTMTLISGAFKASVGLNMLRCCYRKV